MTFLKFGLDYILFIKRKCINQKLMYRGTKCLIVDNSGARVGRVIHTSSIFYPSSLGAVILVSIIKRDFNRKRIRLGQVFRALVIGRGFKTRRVFGQSVYSSNTLVLIKRSEIVPVSKRINGPVPLELRKLKLLKFLAMGTYVF